MPIGDDEIEPLRKALSFSPENLELKRHLAGTLLKYCRYDEAEREYRALLSSHPDDPLSKTGLAEIFYKQGKLDESLVLVETLAEKGDAPAKTYLVYARLLTHTGNIPKAVEVYKKCIDKDPGIVDEELSELLGIMGTDHDEVQDGRVRAFADGDDGMPLQEFSVSNINFGDVGGMDDLKEQIGMKIIHPLKHPELFEAYGKKIGGGILMYGPPGCGKTYLARATAGEVKAKFLSIGISDILDMWIGSSERNLHELFEQARSHKPCVLFFDEVDALGASRTDFKHSSQRNVINQFLSELDGIDSVNDGLLVLAATNTPWHLDSAFRRPGRFDRIIFVPPPDQDARSKIFELMVKGKPTENLNFEELGKKTDRFSGADLKAVVEQAIEDKLTEAMKTGIPSPMTQKDLLKGIKKIKPSTKEWFTTAKNYALYSNQGGIYDDILDYLKIRK